MKVDREIRVQSSDRAAHSSDPIAANYNNRTPYTRLPRVKHYE